MTFRKILFSLLYLQNKSTKYTAFSINSVFYTTQIHVFKGSLTFLYLDGVKLAHRNYIDIEKQIVLGYLMFIQIT